MKKICFVFIFIFLISFSSMSFAFDITGWWLNQHDSWLWLKITEDQINDDSYKITEKNDKKVILIVDNATCSIEMTAKDTIVVTDPFGDKSTYNLINHDTSLSFSEVKKLATSKTGQNVN